MTSKPLTTPPSGPVLVKRVVPVIAAAAIVTGCAGCPGDPAQPPPDAHSVAQDAGISIGPIDVGILLPPDDAAIVVDAPAGDAPVDDASGDDAGPVGDDAD